MKLNYDLIRDLLLTIEDISDSSINYPIDHIHQNYLTNYDLSELIYHTRQLSQGGIIQTASSDSRIIIDLTWYGHQYLSNIRDSSVWIKTKEKIKPFGSVAFDLIFEVSKSIVVNKLFPNS